MFKPDKGIGSKREDAIDSAMERRAEAPKKSLEAIGEERATAIAEKAKKTWGGIKKGFFRLLASPEAVGRGTIKATGAVVEKAEFVSDKIVEGLEGGMDIAGRGAKAVGRAGMEAGAFVASKTVEGATTIKKKTGEVMDGAREKYDVLKEKGEQAYESLLTRVNATKGKFFEYVNNKKMEILKAQEDKRQREKEKEIKALVSMQDQIRKRIAALSNSKMEATA